MGLLSSYLSSIDLPMARGTVVALYPEVLKILFPGSVPWDLIVGVL